MLQLPRDLAQLAQLRGALALLDPEAVREGIAEVAVELERPRVAVEVLLLERLARSCEVAEARTVQVDWVGAHRGDRLARAPLGGLVRVGVRVRA